MTLNGVGAPPWAIKVAETDVSAVAEKIKKETEANDRMNTDRDGKDGGFRGNRKKVRPTRYVRARARLPTSGPEKANYDLPRWVADDKEKETRWTRYQ